MEVEQTTTTGHMDGSPLPLLLGRHQGPVERGERACLRGQERASRRGRPRSRNPHVSSMTVPMGVTRTPLPLTSA